MKFLLSGCFNSLGLRNGPIVCAYLETREAPHSNVLAKLADFLRNQFLDADGLVLDEGCSSRQTSS